MEKRLQFVFVSLFLSQIAFSIVSSTPYPLERGNEENENKTEVVVNPVVNANVTTIASNEIKSIGYEGSCDGENQCDATKSLTCSAFGQCECDPKASEELFYSKSLQKCVEEVDASMAVGVGDSWEAEVDSSSAEVVQEELPNLSELEKDSHDDSHQHDHPHSHEEEVKTIKINIGGEDNKVKKEVEIEVDENDVDRGSEENKILGAGVGSGILAQPCNSDAQCQSRKFGNYSRCLINTGSCECDDTERVGSMKRPTMLVNGICYISRTVGDACSKHEDCSPTIQGVAWCATNLETSKKTCQCGLLHYWDSSLKECLGFGRDGLDSKCKKDYQCSEETALGPLARCRMETGDCECYDTATNGKSTTVYYDDTKRCYYEKSLKSYCLDDKECEASLGMNSFCGNHTDVLPQEKVCQCMPGKSCERIVTRERPGISTYTMIVFIAAGIAMLVGIVLCFVLRKNDRYDIVSQSP